MKKVIIILLCVLFAGALVAAALVFPKLRAQYNAEQAAKAEVQEEVPEAEPEPEPEAETEPEPEAEEEMAADFTVYDLEGNPVTLSGFVGKPTVVNFWATWCMYCVEELPDFNKVYEEYKDQVNFVMVDMTDDYGETPSVAMDYVEEQSFTFPVYFDTDASAAVAYSIEGIPMTLLVDENGVLHQTHIGLMDEATLRDYIEKLIN